jgi:accessory gene regulator B
MFSSIAEKITMHLEANNAFKSEDRAIYQYGIQQGLSIMLNLSTALLLGIVTGMIWESIIFSAAYMLLRRYAGGFHAKTPARCYIYSSAMVLLALLGIKYVFDSILISICMFIVGSLIIFLFSPVEDKNKPLDAAEQLVYQKRTRFYLIVEIVLDIAMMSLGFKGLYEPISISLFCLGILVALGKVKNVIRNKNVRIEQRK